MQKQRKIIVTRNKANTEKLTLIKVYINEKPPQNKEDYLYYKQEKNYLTREENFLMKEKAKRKNLKQSVPLEEINEFRAKIDEELENLAEKKREKKKEEMEEWRGKIEIPEFHYPIIEEDENEEKNNTKKENYERNKTNKEKLIEEIKGKPIIIDKKKKKERMERVIALTESNEDRIKRNNKDMFYDYRKKRIILHKRDVSSTKNNRNQRITWDLKLSPIQYDTQDDISKKIRVAKHFNLSKSYEKTKLIIPSKPYDYLEEQIKQRNNKRINHHYSNSENIKWNKILQNPNRTKNEKIENVKYECEKIDKEAKRNEQFLRINGGIENYPEIGEKVSSLLVESIKGKLSILNTISGI